MQYGICCGPEMAETADRAGFDFFEWSLGALLRPHESAEVFATALANVRKGSMDCPVVNCFIPNDLKITGPSADICALEKYVTISFQRALEANVAVIVFGSGGARQVPDGFDRARAYQQIVDFCRMLAPIADRYGVTIAVEPLNRKECNILNTVSECADLVREINHSAIRLLVDAYHFLLDRDSYDDVMTNGHLLAHVHIATVPNRLPPDAESCDLLPFFKALVNGGYDGRVSIEGKIPNRDSDLLKALSCMKKLEEKAKKNPN